jgi:hypothetical protein
LEPFDGSFHHLIALFPTVAGIHAISRGFARDFFFEIKYLAPILQAPAPENLSKSKHLQRGLQVKHEDPADRTTL